MTLSALIGLMLAVMVPLIGAGVWLIRLEGRLNTHERGCAERQKLLDERHVEIRRVLDDLDRKVDRLLERAVTREGSGS